MIAFSILYETLKDLRQLRQTNLTADKNINGQFQLFQSHNIIGYNL